MVQQPFKCDDTEAWRRVTILEEMPGRDRPCCLPYIESQALHTNNEQKINTHEENTGAGATVLNFFLEIRDHSSAMPIQSNENRSITECPLRARLGRSMHSCCLPETQGVMGEMRT